MSKSDRTIDPNDLDSSTPGDAEAASRWHSVIESAVDGIIVIDARGRIEAFNPAAERLFGYHESEVLGQNVRLLMPPPYRDEHDKYLQNYLETGVPKIIGKGREVMGRRRDGTTFPLHLAVGEMLVGGEPKFTGILHDLSDRIRLEQQLREQASLAKLGEMAAVVAHEVKNPLAGVRAAIQLLGKQFEPGSEGATVVTQIVTRLNALNDLMKDLLLFARPPKPRRVPVDIAAVVASTAGLLAGDPALKSVQVEIEGVSPPVLADPELLRIVFLNLMLNGGQAMAGRGTIRVRIQTTGAACRVAFGDDGPGIPGELRERVFMPFFTTKQRGTGLGLATARRLVEALGGSISIESPETGGTVVAVQLPAN